jgi:hypothetical protein
MFMGQSVEKRCSTRWTEGRVYPRGALRTPSKSSSREGAETQNKHAQVVVGREVLEGCTRSELQRAQSKKNGAKSRGPKTIAGREKSKMNATKHGLRARTLVLPGESAED